MSWDVRVLKLGQAEVPVPQVLFLTGFDQWCVLNFYMVVATQGDKVAIVNCGMPDDLTDINKFWEVSFGDPYGKRTQIVRTEEERPLNALASIGIKPEDVGHVIITPMMAYSAAHLTAFPNAVYWLSRKGFVDRIVPRKGVIKVRGGEAPPIANYRAPIDIFLPEEQLQHLLYHAYHRVNFLDEAEVEPGLRDLVGRCPPQGLAGGGDRFDRRDRRRVGRLLLLRERREQPLPRRRRELRPGDGDVREGPRTRGPTHPDA